MSKFEMILILARLHELIGEKAMKRISTMILLALMTIITLSVTGQPLNACNSLAEDINGDGVIDLSDVILVIEAYGSFPGHPRWNPKTDVDSDGEVGISDIIAVIMKFGSEEKINSDLIVALDIHPESLNLKSKGRWITVQLVFFGNCNMQHALNISMLKLNNTIPAEIMHQNSNAVIAKFNRAAVQSLISNNISLTKKFTTASLSVTGEIAGTTFTATDSIKVISDP
ncbi:MAG: hypothetical protein JSV51_04150 [Candidatus Bathyarchaeota archaeon]|nr:MAG: hypothetical protein JSV51_04150 [Candidatus Bathyarchaeota archaeon]